MPLEAEWEREMKGKKKKKKITWNFCINGLVTILINWISFFLGNHLGSCSICHLRRWKIGDIYHRLLSSICWSFGGAGFYIHPNSWMCMLTAEQPSVLWWISPDSKAKKKKKKLMHSGLMWNTSHMQETLHHNSIQTRSVKGLWHTMIIISSNS